MQVLDVALPFDIGSTVKYIGTNENFVHKTAIVVSFPYRTLTDYPFIAVQFTDNPTVTIQDSVSHFSK